MDKFFVTILLLVSLLASSQDKPEGLFINSKAPDFKVRDQHGTELRLRDLLKNTPVVLVFYQGHWSPQCIRHLKKLEDSLHFINEKKALLIAVTPEKPEYISKTIEKTNASFSILYDEDMKIAKAYDADYEVDARTVARYKTADIDLGEINGQKDKILLPVPAAYIISKEGTVTFRFFDPDNKKRVSVLELLDNLK